MKVEVVSYGTMQKMYVDGKILVNKAGTQAVAEEGENITCMDVADWMQQAYQAGMDEGAGNFVRVPDKVCQTMDEFNEATPE